MPYEVSYDEKDEIILLRASGKVTQQEHYDAHHKAFRLSGENKSSMMLVNLQDIDTSKTSTQDCFDFGQFLAEADIDPSTHIAVLMPKDLDSGNDVQFVTTVATNRGRNIRRFETSEEAKKWLLKSKA